MTLEAQLAELAKLGLRLEPHANVADLLHSFDRARYEERPFDLLMVMLGAEVESEPWGRPFCRSVWNFDTECVEGDGSYVSIVQSLARVAAKTDRVTDVKDHVDLEAGDGWLEYSVDTKRRRLDIEVDSDWVDPVVLDRLMEDLEEPGKRFYGIDNGQAVVLLCLTDAQAAELGRLTNGALKAMVAR